MPRLRVYAGPSPSELEPLRPNRGDIAEIASDVFEGKVAVYIKGYDLEAGDATYFGHDERKEVTWSIQVQGKSASDHSHGRGYVVLTNTIW